MKGNSKAIQENTWIDHSTLKKDDDDQRTRPKPD